CVIRDRRSRIALTLHSPAKTGVNALMAGYDSHSATVMAACIQGAMSVASQTSVVIAGAGPVGLGLACELGLRGIDCLLVEKRDGIVTVPKQSMVSSRNMEICRRWCVAEKVRSAVWPESHPRDSIYLSSRRGHELLRVQP